MAVILPPFRFSKPHRFAVCVIFFLLNVPAFFYFWHGKDWLLLSFSNGFKKSAKSIFPLFICNPSYSQSNSYNPILSI
jgi:hypothetical protein